MKRIQDTIDLPTIAPGPRLVGNKIRSLRRNPRAVTPQIVKVCELALMLISLSRDREAEALLDGVIPLARYQGDERRWGAFGDCIVVRAHLMRMGGNEAGANRLMGMIREHELVSTRRDFETMARECLSDHPGEFDVSVGETPAHATAQLTGLASLYLNFIESVAAGSRRLSSGTLDDLKNTFAECIEEIARRIS